MAVPIADAKTVGAGVHVPKCPYCGKAHDHPYAQATGVRQAPCGKGAYRILLSLGNAAASRDVETKAETPRAKAGRRAARRV